MKKQVLKKLPIFILLLLFSCTKDLETPTQVSTLQSERPTALFYNQTTTIDRTILLSLKQDTLFNEYVRFLDYTYLLHLTDSLRKTTNNEKEFHTQYQDILQKRSGTLKERFVKIKEHYPKDFFTYVTYESKLRRDNSKTETKNVDIGDVIVDGSEEAYSKMANCYNSIYGAFISLANQSFALYSSKIKVCPYRESLSYERLVKSTMDVLGLGFPSIYNAQGLSDNFTRTIRSADVRMAAENGYLGRMTVNEVREESEICVGLISNVLTWNGNFEFNFVIAMSCYESHDSGGTTGGGGGSGGGSGGTTNPPNPETSCSDAKCSICKKCINSTKINCRKCNCTINPCDHIKCDNCKKSINFQNLPETRSTSYSCNMNHDYCTCDWWTKDHNTITKLALKNKLTEQQYIKFHEGQVFIDKKQETTESYLHAMRFLNQSRDEAIQKMKTFFCDKVIEFSNNSDYQALGMAIHPIQDAYSPAHDFNVWTGTNLLPHLYEGMLNYPDRVNRAVKATNRIYDEIISSNKPISRTRVEAIFDAWEYRYENNQD